MDTDEEDRHRAEIKRTARLLLSRLRERDEALRDNLTPEQYRRQRLRDGVARLLQLMDAGAAPSVLATGIYTVFWRGVDICGADAIESAARETGEGAGEADDT